MNTIAPLMEALCHTNPAIGCEAMRLLAQESAQSDAIYAYFDHFIRLLSHRNSYVRSRALTLLAANAQWDDENRLAHSLDVILPHITDEKPITARQCLRALSVIVQQQPALAERVDSALQAADTSAYADSMRPLVDRDIAALRTQIAQQQK